MDKNKTQQKLVSFTENSSELDKVKEDMRNGWSIISLVKNGSYYVGIMELSDSFNEENETLYIPPRKKIKISAHN
ncbi:MAG: DUF2674 domain-containing protein [Rickettsiaceae bacterium]|nr:DUF2674 domain-containing protein [Rickettsiaceae bacterium]